MPHKKRAIDQPAPEEKELIDRVDAMMDIKRTDEAPLIEAPSADQPIDIFKDLKTKPPVITDEPEAAAPVVAIPAEISPIVEEAIPDPDPTPVPAADITNDSTDDNDLDDEKIEQVIDDIILTDSDELLAAEDIVNKTAPTAQPKKKGLFGKLFK